MAIQILEANPSKSFAQKLNAGLGPALQMGQQLVQEHYQKKEQAEQVAKENEAIKRNFGLDLSGITDPKQRQVAVSELLKGQNKQRMTPLQEEQQRLAVARRQEIESTNDLFNQGFGNQQSNQMMSQEEPDMGIPDHIRAPQQQQQNQPNQQGQSELSGASSENLRKLAAFAGQPGRKGVLGTMAKNELEARGEIEKKRSKKEDAYFNMNEPKLEKIADTERKLDIENARYGRLGELFSDPSKFPSGLTAALFTKEGQINDIAYSQLSPEAQEAVKLIIDSTSNIKDTYGARVTNFDLQTYLRKLPSLLNSHEGRQRVLKDLQDLNAINQIYNRGIQDIFDKAGGTDKIAFSEAEKRFKKQYGPQLKRMLEDFANPKQSKFKDRPDPKRFMGKRIKDDETGEVYISDGNQWKPFEG